MLKGVGIDMQIQSNEFGRSTKTIKKGNFQMFSLSVGDSRSRFLPGDLPLGQHPPGARTAVTHQPAGRLLIEQGRATFDQAKRKQAYDEVQASWPMVPTSRSITDEHRRHAKATWMDSRCTRPAFVVRDEDERSYR